MPGPGIEPGLLVPQTNVLPLYYPSLPVSTRQVPQPNPALLWLRGKVRPEERKNDSNWLGSMEGRKKVIPASVDLATSSVLGLRATVAPRNLAIK